MNYFSAVRKMEGKENKMTKTGVGVKSKDEKDKTRLNVRLQGGRRRRNDRGSDISGWRSKRRKWDNENGGGSRVPYHGAAL